MFSRRRPRAEEGRPRREAVAGVDRALDPDLLDRVALPVGEQADAVAARHDLVEVRFERGQRQVAIHVLADVEGGLNVQRQPGDDAERAEADDRAGEGVAVLLAREGDEVAGGVDEFDRRDRRRQVAEGRPRSVRGGRAGAGDGDVRQGGDVVERVALLVERGPRSP